MANSSHPSDQALSNYGLGKLDDVAARAIHAHLESCLDCRRRVAGIKPDSFLDRLREGQAASSRSAQAGTLVEGTLPAQPAAAPPPTAESLPPGLADLPNYRIIKELGRGGMGVVYHVHNLMMGRDEALKVMGRHLMVRAGALERFQREIRSVAQLQDSHIVAAHHAFYVEGALALSMEYVKGADLYRLVKAKGPLTVAYAANFAQQVALGLQHAHGRGLIHRDIKPQNLMLTTDGKLPLVKVLDFGLAKATREEKADTGLTGTGQALGTPDYIAPEQILNAATADIRADLYSLGGTLFYLLTGRPPFRATSLYDMYQAHISRDADPLNLIRPEVPAELAALVAKLLAKEPGQRFQTPGDVALALKPFLSTARAGVQKARPAASASPPPEVERPGVGASDREPASRSASRGAGDDDRFPEIDRAVAQPLPAQPGGPRVDRPANAQPWPARRFVAATAATLALIMATVALVLRGGRGGGPAVVDGGPVVAAAPPDGGAPRSRASPAPDRVAARDKQIADRLSRIVPVDFPNDTPLADFLNYIRQAGQRPGEAALAIYVDRVGLSEADRTEASTVAIQLRGATLDYALKLALAQLGLGYKVTCGMIYITSSDAESWKRCAGVAAAPEVRDRSERTRAALRLLDREVAVHFPDDTPLADVLRHLSASSSERGQPGLEFHVDRNGLLEADRTEASPVAIDLDGLALRHTLRLMLAQLGLDYFIKNGIVTITKAHPRLAVVSPEDSTHYWTDRSRGAWTSQGRRLRHQATGSGNQAEAGGGSGFGAEPRAAVLHAEREDYGDLTIRLRVKAEGEGPSYLIVRRPEGENDSEEFSGYAVVIETLNSPGKPHPGLGSIAKVSGATSATIDEFDSQAEAGDPSEWHQVEIVVAGNRIESMVDGKPAAGYTDRDATFKVGTIAFACHERSGIRIEDLTILENGQ